MKKAMLAFDLGASSGRGIIGYFEAGRLLTEEIYRFDNHPIRRNGHLCWAIDVLVQELMVGIQTACQQYTIESIGIDTWGVDYGVINQDGNLKEFPRHYRDSASDSAFQSGRHLFSEEALFRATGNQVMAINSLFRLMQEHFVEGDRVLFMPDLLGYLLTGVLQTESSIAATSQLLSWQTCQWHQGLLQQAQIPPTVLPPLVCAGKFLGNLDIAGLPALPVYKVLGHDTACAVASVPSNEEDFLFLSCGTWALAGTELAEADVSAAAFQAGFTNEGGGESKTRFLKNLTGMWLIQELRHSFQKSGRCYEFSEMNQLAATAKDTVLIDTQNPALQKPGAMLAKICHLMQEQGSSNQPEDGEVIRCVYQSLARNFAKTFDEIQQLTGKQYKKIYVVGGGSQANFLCQTLADYSGKIVWAGPAEATAYGNLALQAIALGKLTDITTFRHQLQQNTSLNLYQPQEENIYELS